MGDRTGANDCLELLEHPELARYVHETVSRLHASAVVIFGSRARRDHLQVSDYDLAVVSPDFRGLNRLRRRDKLYEVWDEVGPDADADIFGLTHEELLAMKAPMLWDILEEGKPLHDDGTWRAARAQFEQRKAAGYIIAVEGGWRIGEARLSGPGQSPHPLRRGSMPHHLLCGFTYALVQSGREERG